MTLLNDILNWSSALPSWQRDALRRLFQKGNVDNKDIDELYTLLKASRGLPNPNSLQVQPLEQAHLPSTSASATQVILTGMRDLRDVNIIGPTEHLKFAPTGITVIYGNNGSGKSGYARVLKRACRARDTAETVLPDARDPASVSKVPTATFEVMDAGIAKNLKWKRGAAPPGELSSVAVFDGKCARAYLDDEHDVAYLPYGLDIVENLGQKVLPAVAEKLQTEIGTISIDISPFADLTGPTKVGQVIGALSYKTDPNVVMKLATLSVAEHDRLKELEATLAENDPTAKAKALRLAADRITGLHKRIDTAVTTVSDHRVQAEKTIDEQAEAAQAAEKLVAEQFCGGEALLPGTGNRLWKTLMEAAEAYSTKEAYPDSTFPHTETGAQCVLCQQSLTELAGERLKRFDAFLKDRTSREATNKATNRSAAQQALERASVSFQFDAALAAELNQHDSSLGQQIATLEASVEERRKAIIAAHKSHNWMAVRAIAADVRPALDKLAQSLTQQAGELDKAADVTLKKALETERAELKAREQLSKRLQAVLELIQRMKLHQRLETCNQDLNTKRISDKVKDFTNSAVTEALRKALEDEFQKLGVGHIETKLNERVEKGKTKHKLILDLPRSHTIEAILSEGEQRAIAIGSFFAELGLSGQSGGVVFDDPVSSLDHEHRRQVAARIVDEASRQQVIVFTHDAAFLGELRDALDQAQVKVPCSFCHLEWRNRMSGGVVDGLPWDHQGYKERLHNLRRKQTELAKTWPPHPASADVDAMRNTYSKLRATIERVVQDMVLNGVVQRYSDYVQVKQLKAVAVLMEADCNEIERLIDKCHKITEAHDPSSAKTLAIPLPSELEQDIADLEKVIGGIIDRRNAAPQ